jgi:hypothetical protein
MKRVLDSNYILFLGSFLVEPVSGIASSPAEVPGQEKIPRSPKRNCQGGRRKLNW